MARPLKWTRRDVNPANIPRPQFLTSAQIASVLDAIPLPICKDPLAAQVSLQVLRKGLKDQLKKIQLIPQEQFLTHFQDIVRRAYQGVMVKRGEPVGRHLADALGASATQLALDSFSLLGVASAIGSGRQGIKTLLDARLNRPDPAMSVHFRMPVTREDIMEMRSLIVSQRVKDYVARSEIGVFVPNFRLLRPVPSRPELPFLEAEEAAYAAKENPAQGALLDPWVVARVVANSPDGMSQSDKAQLNELFRDVRAKLTQAGMDFRVVPSVAEPGRSFEGDSSPAQPSVNTHSPRSFDLVVLVDPSQTPLDKVRQELQVLEWVNGRLRSETSVQAAYQLGVLVRDVQRLRAQAEAEKYGLGLQSEWWHDLYRKFKLNNQSLEMGTFCLRLHLKKEQLYQAGFSVNQLADIIASEDFSEFIEENSVYKNMTELMKQHCFDVVPSPLEVGIIDIVPRMNRLEPDGRAGRDLALLMCDLIRKGVDMLQIKGISEITSLDPVSVDYVNTFKSQRRVASDPTGKTWRLELDVLYIKSNMVRYGDILNFLLGTGVQIRKLNVSSLQRKALEILAARGIEVHNAPKRYRSLLVETPEPVSDLFSYLIAEAQNRNLSFRYNYAIAKGSNLKAMLAIPWVDDSRTITNDIHQICEFYGVEAARNYFLHEWVQVMIGSGVKDIDYHVTILLGDFMFGYGIFLGIKTLAMAKRGEGFLSLAMGEKLKQVLVEAAPVSATENASNSMVSIMLGQPDRVGDFMYGVDKSKESVDFISNYLHQMQLQNQYRLDPDRFPAMEARPQSSAAESQLESWDLEAALLPPATRSEQPDGDDSFDNEAWPSPDYRPPSPAQAQGRPSSMPSWWATAELLYTAKVKRCLKWAERDLARASNRPLFSYLKLGDENTDPEPWFEILNRQGFRRQGIGAKLTVDYLETWPLQGHYDTRARGVRARLVNALRGLESLFDKGLLHIHFKTRFPQQAASHLAQTTTLGELVQTLQATGKTELQFKTPLILRPTGPGTGEGRDVIIATTATQVLATYDKVRNSTRYSGWIASQYITSPALLDGRKFHFRVPMVVGLLNGKLRWELFNQGQLYVAPAPYVAGQWERFDIHLSSEFAGGYPQVLLSKGVLNAGSSAALQRQLELVAQSLASLVENKLGLYGDSQNGYQMLMLDFLMDAAGQAVLLEVDPVPTRAGPEYVPWSEADTTYSEALHQWLYGAIFQPLFGAADKVSAETGSVAQDQRLAYPAFNLGRLLKALQQLKQFGGIMQPV